MRRKLVSTEASLQLKLGRGLRFMEAVVGRVDWSDEKVFGFHRHKDRELDCWGWDIWLWVGSHGLNLTSHGVAPFPNTKADARDWVCDFAEEHGFEPWERQRPNRGQRGKPRLTLLRDEP